MWPNTRSNYFQMPPREVMPPAWRTQAGNQGTAVVVTQLWGLTSGSLTSRQCSALDHPRWPGMALSWQRGSSLVAALRVYKVSVVHTQLYMFTVVKSITLLLTNLAQSVHSLLVALLGDFCAFSYLIHISYLLLRTLIPALGWGGWAPGWGDQGRAAQAQCVTDREGSRNAPDSPICEQKTRRR